jgi:putative phosphoesterase
MKIKIGVLSDTHLRRVDNHFRDTCDRFFSDVDLILHAGDFVSPGIADFLSRKAFQGVAGNMDPMEVKEMLPEKKVIELGPYRVGLIHGSGPSDGLEDRIWSEFENVDVIVYGHTHRSACHRRDGVLLFNPGTATGFIYSGVHTIGVLEFGETINAEIIPID